MVGEPGEELPMVVKTEVSPQVVILMEVFIASCTRKMEIVMFVVIWKNQGMS